MKFKNVIRKFNFNAFIKDITIQVENGLLDYL